VPERLKRASEIMFTIPVCTSIPQDDPREAAIAALRLLPFTFRRRYAPVFEQGLCEHAEVDAVKARAHDAKIPQDELQNVQQITREESASGCYRQEQRLAEGDVIP